MDISQLFKICHGSLNVESDLSKIEDSKIIEYVKKKNLDSDKFFKTQNPLYQYCYYNEQNGVFIEIHGFDDDIFNFLQIDKKIEVVENHMNKLIAKQEYTRVFAFLDKKLRIHFFNKWYDRIPKDQILEIFKEVYTLSEYGFNTFNKDILKDIQELSKSELEDLDDVVEIYRGQTPESQNYDVAYSWTLSKKTAKYFANRFNSKGKIFKGKANKKDIIAYIKDRDEEELLIMPGKVYDIKKL